MSDHLNEDYVRAGVYAGWQAATNGKWGAIDEDEVDGIVADVISDVESWLDE